MTDIYPEEIKEWISQLLHKDIKRRCKALNKDVRYFEDLTRKLYLKQKEKG